MPYAQRNEKGEIVALTADSTSEEDQSIGLDNPEVLKFLAGGKAQGDHYFEMLAQDLQQIRILEDLIDLLTSKGIIMFSELPVAAQRKILNKKSIRESFDHAGDILVRDETPLL